MLINYIISEIGLLNIKLKFLDDFLGRKYEFHLMIDVVKKVFCC